MGDKKEEERKTSKIIVLQDNSQLHTDDNFKEKEKQADNFLKLSFNTITILGNSEGRDQKFSQLITSVWKCGLRLFFKMFFI